MAQTTTLAARRTTVAVIGDGAITAEDGKWAMAYRLGGLVMEHGWTLVTGGRGGVMEAVCCGAREAQGYRPGHIIGVLPGISSDEANPYVDVVMPTGLGHARNAIVAQADAIVAIGGGAGTLTEMAMAWIHDRLLIALRVEGWSGQLAGTRIDERPRFGGAIAEDRVFGVHTPEEAVASLVAWLPRYIKARQTGSR